MATYAQLQAIKSANLDTLFAIDGVVGVGIGPRTGPITPTDYSVLTQTTGEDAICVLITKVEAIANVPASLSANGITAPTCVVPSGIGAHSPC